MKENEVSTNGIFAATFVALAGTIGHYLTHGRLSSSLEWVWLGVFAAALIILSGAVVNFDPRRIIK
ncbi:hypothetical protein [Fimbriimonas ginsengisoli]|uniref:Uncharacterized protein n=1 Tax=Fimbriimonas ginsengisoli Gsoil 348 TaxID=661478 RepID=A0A068NQ51_FIMGI|nr:hypothetical protein [Fimbriimonas ginsengisoli]AIE85536.1 hypothetical protein OP10G_2168 [Fimbriimonas ginsengisoli Gsoil 348]